MEVSRNYANSNWEFFGNPVPLYKNMQLSCLQASNKFLKICSYRKIFPGVSITNNIIDSFPTAWKGTWHHVSWPLQIWIMMDTTNT